MKIKPLNFAGGVNTSSRATFGLKAQDVIASVSEAIQRIFTQLSHKFLCHPTLPSKIIQRIVLREVDAGSHDVEILPHGGQAHKAQYFACSLCQKVQNDTKFGYAFCKALAFTLAETLIVMGIIGVVAALTIPNLNSSTGDKEKIAKVKKVYSNLNDAFNRAQAVYGPQEEWGSLDRYMSGQVVRFGDRLTEFMKVSKNCAQAGQGCYPKKITSSSGRDMSDSAYDFFYKFILADGMAVFSTVPNLQVIEVDIDGPNKGPSVYGKDIFRFLVSDSGITTECHDKTFSYMLQLLKADGMCASDWVINYDNMDYLKLKGGKCPNGRTTLTEQNPSCK